MCRVAQGMHPVFNPNDQLFDAPDPNYMKPGVKEEGTVAQENKVELKLVVYIIIMVFLVHVGINSDICNWEVGEDEGESYQHDHNTALYQLLIHLGSLLNCVVP